MTHEYLFSEIVQSKLKLILHNHNNNYNHKTYNKVGLPKEIQVEDITLSFADAQPKQKQVRSSSDLGQDSRSEFILTGRQKIR